MEAKKMKTTHKKLVAGLLISTLIASIGATFASGALDDTTTTTTVLPPTDTNHGMYGIGPFASNLTDEQQTEIWNLITSLRKENATPEEMKAAIQNKLDQFGVLDTWLSSEINQTEQKLAILSRQKELRDEGYSWADIRNITQDEFDLQNMTGLDQGLMIDIGFHHGPCGGSDGFIPPEESDQ
jgi:hypothetical protein